MQRGHWLELHINNEQIRFFYENVQSFFLVFSICDLGDHYKSYDPIKTIK